MRNRILVLMFLLFLASNMVQADYRVTDYVDKYAYVDTYLWNKGHGRVSIIGDYFSDIRIENGEIQGTWNCSNVNGSFYSGQANDTIYYRLVGNVDFHLPYVLLRPGVYSYSGNAEFLDTLSIDLWSDRYPEITNRPIRAYINNASIVDNKWMYLMGITQQTGYTRWNDEYTYFYIDSAVRETANVTNLPEPSSSLAIIGLFLAFICFQRGFICCENKHPRRT